MWIAIGAVSLGIWLVLLLGRGGFWLFREVIERDPVPEDQRMPAVAVIIPARDEAETIGDAVRSSAGIALCRAAARVCRRRP
jgi:hypothetical protein